MILRTATLLAATVTLLAGCGGKPTKKMVTATGTVNYNGQQLQVGILKFIAPNGDYNTASILPGGKFTMSEIVPGQQKVGYVLGPQGSGSSSGKDEGPKVKLVAVPAKFADPATSGVTVNVPEDGGEIVVEIK